MYSWSASRHSMRNAKAGTALLELLLLDVSTCVSAVRDASLSMQGAMAISKRSVTRLYQWASFGSQYRS